MIHSKTTNLMLRAAMRSVPRISQYYSHKQLTSDKACETKQVKSAVVILSGRGSKETTKTPSGQRMQLSEQNKKESRSLNCFSKVITF